MLPLTQHAKDKICIYGIEENEVEAGLDQVIFYCEDVVEKSGIKVIEIRNVLFVVVLSAETKKIITIYRTDAATIENRRRAGRWICY
ncbi:MAG: hypothetical protein ACOYOE_07505 [Chlorobium sp.]